MSVAWTTAVFIYLLLPGVFFFAGLAARERTSRELIRSNAIEDLGLAIAAAVTAHFLAWQGLSLLSFNHVAFFLPLLYVAGSSPSSLIETLTTSVQYAIGYIAVVSAITFGFGMLLAWLISRGHFRFLVRHKWVYDLLGNKDGLVTAYVMTKTHASDYILMYRGVLSEFYLLTDGRISYVILKDCSRFGMKLTEGIPMTGAKRDLFQDHSEGRKWNYLAIDGAEIANVLFDKSAPIRESQSGREALGDALKDLDDELLRELEAAIARDAR